MILLLISLPFYFLPAFIAGARNHQNGFAIFVLNFFTGWTLLGWIAAFIWACVGEKTVTEPRVDPALNWDRKVIYERPQLFASMQTQSLSEKLSEPIFKD